MNPAVKRHIVITMVILGCLCIARGVWGAEQPKPFQWALVMALPGKPAEVRWLFDSETACEYSAKSDKNIAPAGTVFQCQRRKGQ